MQFAKIQILLALTLALLSSPTSGVQVTKVTPNESSSSDLAKIKETNVIPIPFDFYEL